MIQNAYQLKKYYSIGLMSGSSMDGLDLAYSSIAFDEGKVADWELIASETMPYSDLWRDRLMGLTTQSALIFAKTHQYYAHYLSELIQQFIQKNKIQKIDFIASHGHTIFHEPEKKYTVQIGDGAVIAARTGIDVISDFRTQDVALNGEGAPLAPLADKYLFGAFDFYLNLGGIANLSGSSQDQWIAFDCCPANQVLNVLANEMGLDYDEGGKIAAKGKVNPELLEAVSSFDYYTQTYPKSLGNEWIRKYILPLYLQAACSIEDKLATACEHIAIEISQAIQMVTKKEKIIKKTYEMLVTGGGAYNEYLMQCIHHYCNRKDRLKLIFPKKEIIDFKEALLMSLLGVLFIEGKSNSLATVTGADRDTINGSYHKGKA